MGHRHGNAAPKVKFVNGTRSLPAATSARPGDDGHRAEHGRGDAMDTDLLAPRQFYGTDFTKPLLFIADGEYYDNLAQPDLTGDQWA